MRILLFSALIFLVSSSHAQVVFEPTGNVVYQFLDEMAAAQRISLNSFAKPYARTFIAQKLDTISRNTEGLNKRQLEQLAFLLRDYGKELQVGKDWDRRKDVYYHSDSTFAITIYPVLAGSVMANENGTRVHRRVGAGFIANAGKFGFSGSLRDNAVSEVLATPQYLTARQGENYKTISADNRSDFNEAFGMISYQWKWGDVSLLKDRYIWGNAARSANVFSGKAPSYAAISYRLYPLKWLDFQYVHGWLVSEELDSARTYLTPNGNRKIYMNKNIAANYFTMKSNFKTDFTFGNSIIYSDNGLQPVYFIPFMFFKSADHTYSGTGSNELGQNAQLFFDISTRALKNVHFYTSLFIDEVSISNIWDSDQQTNIMSLKLGATWYNALPNVHLTAEYTRTHPWTYRHQIESTTFASNGYNLGNYLGENADEIFLAATLQPTRNIAIRTSLWSLRKGPQHVYEIISGNANVTGLKTLETIDFEQVGFEINVNWEIINDLHLFGGATVLSNSDVDPFGESYVPDYLSNTGLTGEIGFRIAW